jgi:hypothetical protein
MLLAWTPNEDQLGTLAGQASYGMPWGYILNLDTRVNSRVARDTLQISQRGMYSHHLCFR